MAASYSKSKGRSSNSRYFLLDHNLLDSPDFLKVSSSAKVALLALCRQYNGRNNGDLSLTNSRAKDWKLVSKSTLSKALRELESANLIVRSRDPRKDRNNPHGQCSLYALTWLKIDECNGKHDLAPTVAPLRALSLSLVK